MQYSVNVNYIKLIDRAVKDIYILTDFCLSDLSITNREVLKFPTIIVDFMISPLISTSFALEF